MSEGTEYVESDLIPEMVHDRCFCEPGSREFVELESVNVEESLRSAPKNSKKPWECYRAKAVVKFSGEPETFPLIVKLLSPSGRTENAFARFQNEEMFYSKMVTVYGKDQSFPKCYLSDLGRYGTPVIVLEDLLARGYETVRRRLVGDEFKLCLETLAKFHGTGFKLKAEKFHLFREFQAKLLDTTFDEESIPRHEETLRRFRDALQSSDDTSSLAKEAAKAIGSDPLETAREACTRNNDFSCICHGAFSPGKVLFKRDQKDGRAVDARIIDWQTMRYCSPAIDLGFVLLANFPLSTRAELESESSRARRFLRETLTLYVDAVEREYPPIARERFEREILSVLTQTLPYFLLSCREEDWTDRSNVETLLACSQLFREYSSTI